MNQNVLPDLGPVLPEMFVAVAAMALLMIGVFRGDGSTRLIAWLSIVVLVVAIVLVRIAPQDSRVTLAAMFVADPFATFMKSLALLGSALAILMSLGYIRREAMERFEYPILILLATLGMMMMVSANDFIALYVGVELQSLALYVVAAFKRDSLRSTEAGLKYFVLGALSSGLLLYGCSLIYGFTGSTNFDALASLFAVENPPVSIGLVIGLVFLISGLAFKVSAVPFHMWTPDVYEGAAHAGHRLLRRRSENCCHGAVSAGHRRAFPRADRRVAADHHFYLDRIDAARRLRRNLAVQYQAADGLQLDRTHGLCLDRACRRHGRRLSWCAHLHGDLSGDERRRVRMHPVHAPERGHGSRGIEDLAGLSRSNPPMALAMGIFMFSLAGIPPLAGFFGKFYVFLAAINAELYTLAVVGVLASVVGALLLPAHRQDHVFRCSGGVLRAADRRGDDARDGRRRGVYPCSSSSIRRRSSRRPRPRQRRCCDDGSACGGDAPHAAAPPLLPAHSVGRDRQHQRRSQAPCRSRRAGRHLGVGGSADHGSWAASPALALAPRATSTVRSCCVRTARPVGRRSSPTRVRSPSAARSKSCCRPE